MTENYPGFIYIPLFPAIALIFIGTTKRTSSLLIRLIRSNFNLLIFLA